MSAKWIRSKKWDDEHIPSWAWPVKFVLRTFSGIPLAVVLLSTVVVYAILASVPIGLIVLGATYIVYGLTLVVAVAGVALVPVMLVRAFWRPKSPGARTARFVATLAGSIALVVVAAELWYVLAWPRLMYDPAQGTGLRLFPGFVEAYKATTLRRLPGLEMSELEFYSWWPLRVILLLFVLNMITATARRIEFAFPNIGVISVHSGIVVIALGSVYYSGLKLEGDTMLLSGEIDPEGNPTVGPAQELFYDNTRTVLWLRQGAMSRWEQRDIQPPRYNDYNLGASGTESARAKIGRIGNVAEGGRTLDQPVLRSLRAEGGVDGDISLRLVGYASYAEPTADWVRAERPIVGPANPVRFAELRLSVDADGKATQQPVNTVPFYFLPDDASNRLGETEFFGLEYTRGMPEQRWADLQAELPQGARHALVVEVPAAEGRNAYRGVFAVENGQELRAGGYTLTVSSLLEQPPFPIITEGYRGATSSVAVVRVTTPDGAAFERYVYHRFPEINQDMLDELNENGMPKRRDADPAIRISYIDASKLQVYIDERGEAAGAPVRAIIRQPGGAARVVADVPADGSVDGVMPGLSLKLTDRWAHAQRVERPQPVPERERRNDMIGTHQKALLAVEVSSGDSAKQVVWLPFTRYLGAGMGTERTVRLNDGRELTLAFGRRAHPLPGFVVQLVDFQMVAYDHRGSPRDYQSLVRVVPRHDQQGQTLSFEPYVHVTKLNAPLQAPFMWSEKRAYFENVSGLFVSRLNPRQFKFSQAGWDQEGWRQTQELTDRGQLKRPVAMFTILQVGNNPGIHIIALGAILMSVGIPWAFYLKPWIMRRRKAKLAARVAAAVQSGTKEPEAVGAGV